MSTLKEKRAQAILELAIFGSILLMLLGLILNYGLRYNFEQRAMMKAFRQALANSPEDASHGGQASYTYIQDRHVPNPANPFAVGQVMPVASSASIVRTYKLNEIADTPEELPRTYIQIEGGVERSYTIADFVYVPSDEFGEAKKRYKEIYGQVWKEKDQNGQATGAYKAVDYCAGQIISYDGCARQCRMFIDNAFCARECERGKLPNESKNCQEICSQPITAPGYCGQLGGLFGAKEPKPKAMGVQSDYSKDTTITSSLTLQSSGGSAENVNWADTTHRTIKTTTGEEKVPTTLEEHATCTNAECEPKK